MHIRDGQFVLARQRPGGTQRQVTLHHAGSQDVEGHVVDAVVADRRLPLVVAGAQCQVLAVRMLQAQLEHGLVAPTKARTIGVAQAMGGRRWNGGEAVGHTIRDRRHLRVVGLLDVKGDCCGGGRLQRDAQAVVFRDVEVTAPGEQPLVLAKWAHAHLRRVSRADRDRVGELAHPPDSDAPAA